MKLAMPDLTPQALVALCQAALGVALAFGLNLSTTQQGELLGLVGILAALLLGHDAVIRRARAQHIAGPLLDARAADAIKAAAATVSPPLKPVDPIAAVTVTAPLEAAQESVAQAANESQPAPGIDPATA